MIYAGKRAGYGLTDYVYIFHGQVAFVKLTEFHSFLDNFPYALFYLVRAALFQRSHLCLATVGNHNYRRNLGLRFGSRIGEFGYVEFAVGKLGRFNVKVPYGQRSVMLERDVGEYFWQMIFKYKVVSVLGMRTDNIGGKFGRKFVVQILTHLVFGKKLGVFEFAHVVIIRASPCEQGVFAYGGGATFRQSRQRDRVIESTRSVVYHSLDKRRFMVGQFGQSVVRKHRENLLEKR